MSNNAIVAAGLLWLTMNSALAQNAPAVPSCTQTCKIAHQLCQLECRNKTGGRASEPPATGFQPSPEGADKSLSQAALKCVAEECQPQRDACLKVCHKGKQ